MNNPAQLGLTFLGGLISATLSLFPLLLIPALSFFSYFAALPLFLLGLGLGRRPLYGAALVATLLIFIFSNAFIAGEFFIFSALGPAFLTNKALLHRTSTKRKIEWYPASLLLRDLTVASAIVMLVGIVAYAYLVYGKEGQNLILDILKAFDPQNQLKEYESLIKEILPFLPGIFAFSWVIMMLINASLAQGLLVQFKKNLRPTPSFQNLQIPPYFLLALGVSLFFAVLGIEPLGLLGKNGMCVFIFPYFLVGLSLIHQGLHKTSYATVGLTLFYFILILFLWPALVVILLGILKPWIEKYFHR